MFSLPMGTSSNVGQEEKEERKKREGNEEESRRETNMEKKIWRCFGDIIFSPHCLSPFLSLPFSLVLSLSFALSICSLSLPHHASLSFFLSIFIIQDTSPVFFACVRFMTTITHGSCKQGTLKRCIRCSYLKRVHPNGVGGRRGTKM